MTPPDMNRMQQAYQMYAQQAGEAGHEVVPFEQFARDAMQAAMQQSQAAQPPQPGGGLSGENTALTNWPGLAPTFPPRVPSPLNEAVDRMKRA